jgi:hypothetical protein
MTEAKLIVSPYVFFNKIKYITKHFMHTVVYFLRKCITNMTSILLCIYFLPWNSYFSLLAVISIGITTNSSLMSCFN